MDGSIDKSSRGKAFRNNKPVNQQKKTAVGEHEVDKTEDVQVITRENSDSGTSSMKTKISLSDHISDRQRSSKMIDYNIFLLYDVIQELLKLEHEGNKKAKQV